MCALDARPQCSGSSEGGRPRLQGLNGCVSTMTASVLGQKARSFWSTALALVLCALPLAIMVRAIQRNLLGPDPAEALMHMTGEWSIRLLLLVLFARPLARYGWSVLMHFRRMLGVSTFFYACLHVLVFLQVYVGWQSDILLEELTERPYVVVGFIAWLILLVLAVTSLKWLRRVLGAHWRRLHQSVYIVAVLVVCHVLWLSRSDIGAALFYGALFAGLLGWRVQQKRKYFTKQLPSE